MILNFLIDFASEMGLLLPPAPMYNFTSVQITSLVLEYLLY